MVQHSNGKISDYKKGVIKKVSDLIIPLLPTAFDVVGSFCFYFFFIKPL